MIVSERGLKGYVVLSAVLLTLPCPFAWLNRARADFFGSLGYAWAAWSAINIAFDLGVPLAAVILLRALPTSFAQRGATVLFWLIALLLGGLVCIGHPSADVLVEWIKYSAIMLIIDWLLPSSAAVVQPHQTQ